MKRINTRAELIELARELGVRNDWHEPDEQEITATTHGVHFDNAGFWPTEEVRIGEPEQYVILYKEGDAVAAVNLATLFSWAATPPKTVTTVTEETVLEQGVRYVRKG